MSALQTHTEQVGHRVRTITTGGRARRCAGKAEIDNCVSYLEQVADKLEQFNMVVDSVAVDGRKPVSGRIRVRRTKTGALVELILCWQQGFGWSTRTYGQDAPPDGWFHLYADDTASPPTVACFLVDGVLPTLLPAAKPDDPGQSVVAS